MATMSQITDLIAFAPLNYSGFWLVINWICPFSIQVNYGIDWKHTDFTEKTYSGDNDDSKNKSISWKRGYNYIIIINIAIKYKNTKLRPVNNFFFKLNGTCNTKRLMQVYAASWSIAAAFWSLSKFICRPNTISSSSFDSIFLISLSLRSSLLPDEDNYIAIPTPSDRWTFKILPSLVPK